MEEPQGMVSELAAFTVDTGTLAGEPIPRLRLRLLHETMAESNVEFVATRATAAALRDHLDRVLRELEGR
jgi:hypothetical protein